MILSNISFNLLQFKRISYQLYYMIKLKNNFVAEFENIFTDSELDSIIYKPNYFNLYNFKFMFKNS